MQSVNFKSSIVEWRPSELYHNFGDHLVWLIGERIFTPAAWLELQKNKSHRYVLLGSFICDYNIQCLINEGYSPVLIGCGYRGEPLSKQLVHKATFYGSRGTLTQKSLREQSKYVQVIGDPAMLLPLLIPKARPSQKTLLVPHISDEKRHEMQAKDIGVDEVVQAETTDIASLTELIQAISAASFVLAGSMHAAIVAHAYGVPFAFFMREGGYLDCPPKWEDWLSSVSVPPVQPVFVQNFADGLQWYHQNKSYLHRNRFGPILKAYANIGRLRLIHVVRALFLDFRFGQLGNETFCV